VPTPLARACASLLALSLASTLPTVVRAAPEPAASAAPPSEAPPSSDVPEEAAVHAALADGDLTTARELAVARSSADPSVESFVLEAQVWQALGDYEQAKRAYAAALELLGDQRQDDREAIEQELAAVEETSRGTRADEPASTERERLDRERADRLAALAPKPPPPPVVDVPKPVPITRKWYFWVTLGAIVASAGAIVGLAASSAIDEQKANSSAAARQPMPVGGVLLRF
jgi:hypothetical protein